MITETDELYDEIVVNLKVIASILLNSKLYTKGSLLNLEQPSVVPEIDGIAKILCHQKD